MPGPENPWGQSQSPWGQPPEPTDETRQQWVAPGPQSQQPQQPPHKGNGGLIAAIVAVIIALALVAVAVWFFLLRDDGDDPSAAPSARFTESAPTTEAEQSSTVETTPSPTPAPVSPSRSPQSTPSSTGSSPSDSGPGGLTASGWTGHPDAQCNVSADDWVYAARNSTTWVTVCRSDASGDLYYRGERNGKGYEEDVDMSSADTGRGYFSVAADPSRIVIDGSTLKVLDSSGAVSARETFDDVSRG